MITVSAPGKIHLLGEHSVVYGKPALLAAINKRVYVTITRNPKSEARNPKKINDVIKSAIAVFQKAYQIKNMPDLDITIDSQIPIGSGLGSSSAISAAIIAGLIKTVKNLWNPVRINELTFEMEKIWHGNPSGADNTTVVSGGLIWYRKEFDFLKNIWQLPMSSYKIPNFALIDSGKPLETTKEMVEMVAKFFGKNKKKAQEILNSQEEETKNMLLSLKNGEEKELYQTIRNGENNLEKMEVVSDFAKKIIKEIEKDDGAAKITGAGGRKKDSGMILCLHKDLSRIEKIAKKHKLNYFPIQIENEGIKIEHEKK